MASTHPSSDGRVIALGMVVGYFLLFGLLMVVFHLSMTDIWQGSGVAAMDPHFGDLRNVVAGIQNQDAGRAIGDANPFDPWNRPYIYPSLWLNLRLIGFSSDTVVGFGWLIIVGFYLSVYFLVGRLTRSEGIYTGLLLISPAIMTGIERCNIDLILFPLIFAALALRRWPAASLAMIILATVLKIHPVGALLALLAPPWRRTLPWLAGALGLLGIYVLVNWTELSVISAHAQHYALGTFGSAVVGLWLGSLNPSAGEPDFDGALDWGTLLFLVMGAFIIRSSPRLEWQPSREREIYAFRLGAGLLLALFALGANNDYGMLFLIFCLPLLFRLRGEAGAIYYWASAALLCSAVYVSWDLISDEYMLRHMLIKQAASWILFGSLMAILRATFSWPVAGFAAVKPRPA